MDKMKRILTVILAAVIIIQTGAFAVSAESAADDKQIITISNIDTSQLADGSAGSSAGSATEIKAEGLASNSLKIVSEKWTCPSEYVISGKNIKIKGGKYSYRLVIRSDRTLSFDNDLEIYYQGIDGKYKLHYDIDKTDNHTMIVTGVFDNIIISSPLLEKISVAEREWVLAHVSKDTYFYQLILKTKEGFSFVNSLRFLFDAKKHGYIAKYSYDLLKDEQTLIICGLPDCGSIAAETAAEPANTAAGAAETAQETSTPTVQSAPVTTGGTDNAPTAGTAAPAASVTSPPANAAAPAPAPKAARPAPLKTVTVRYSKLRKKAQTVKMSKIYASSVKVKGKQIYARTAGNRNITVNKKNGNITLKRGLRKGTYKVTVKLTPAGIAGRKASAAKRVTFAVRVI